jgi:hypothetical protein
MRAIVWLALAAIAKKLSRRKKVAQILARAFEQCLRWNENV